MAKMWAGVTAAETDKLADDFNSSIRFDSRMYREDITGSMAHAAMLGATGIITEEEACRRLRTVFLITHHISDEYLQEAADLRMRLLRP